jgi:hypothetical protein
MEQTRYWAESKKLRFGWSTIVYGERMGERRQIGPFWTLGLAKAIRQGRLIAAREQRREATRAFVAGALETFEPPEITDEEIEAFMRSLDGEYG